MPAKSTHNSVLLQHFHHAKDPSISHRAQVILLFLKGWCIREIMEATFQKESTVSRWITTYKKHGIGSIFPGYYNSQNAAKLTHDQKQEIQHMLSDDSLSDDFWHVGKLKEYISARFDITYQSDQSYYALFSLCNYSYKLPSLFNIRRDEQLVSKRVKELRETIAPHMKDPNTLVFTADETRIEWSTLKRRAWLRKGEKTVIKEIKDKKYQNFIGLLNMKTGESLLYRLDWQDQDHIIPVLKQLTQKYSKRTIIIIWDNAGFHRGQKIRSLLGKGNPFENIHLLWLPPYAPDKNPQEHVWRYVKDELGNRVYNRFEDMVEAFEHITTGREYQYDF